MDVSCIVSPDQVQVLREVMQEQVVRLERRRQELVPECTVSMKPSRRRDLSTSA